MFLLQTKYKPSRIKPQAIDALCGKLKVALEKKENAWCHRKRKTRRWPRKSVIESQHGAIISTIKHAGWSVFIRNSGIFPSGNAVSASLSTMDHLSNHSHKLQTDMHRKRNADKRRDS